MQVIHRAVANKSGAKKENVRKNKAFSCENISQTLSLWVGVGDGVRRD